MWGSSSPSSCELSLLAEKPTRATIVYASQFRVPSYRATGVECEMFRRNQTDLSIRLTFYWSHTCSLTVGTPDSSFALSRVPWASSALFPEIPRRSPPHPRAQCGHMTASPNSRQQAIPREHGGKDTCLFPEVDCIAEKHAQLSGASVRMPLPLLSIAQLGN